MVWASYNSRSDNWLSGFGADGGDQPRHFVPDTKYELSYINEVRILVASSIFNKKKTRRKVHVLFP